MDELGANVPQPDLNEAKVQIYALTDAILEGLVLSAHDISEGGLAVTLSEMALGSHAQGRSGLVVDLDEVGENLKSHQKLFSETGGFIVEVAAENAEKFLEICSQQGVTEIYKIGNVSGKNIAINNSGKKVIDLPLDKAANVWFNGLREKL